MVIRAFALLPLTSQVRGDVNTRPLSARRFQHSPHPPSIYPSIGRKVLILASTDGPEIGVMILNLYECLGVVVSPNATVAGGEWIY